MAVEGSSRDLRGLGDRVDRDRRDSAGAQQMSGSVEKSGL